MPKVIQLQVAALHEMVFDDLEQLNPWFQPPSNKHSLLGASYVLESKIFWYNTNIRSNFHLLECLCLTSGKNEPQEIKEDVLLESKS